jgi:hypothetical protein
MKSYRIWMLLLTAAGLAMLAGCETVESDHPLSPPRTAVVDKRLEGMWKNTEKKETGYIYVAYGLGRTGSILQIELADMKEPQINPTKMNFYVTHTPRNDYLNYYRVINYAEGKAEKNRWGTYQFAKYRFNWLEQLILSYPDINVFSDAVKDGKLKGEVTYQTNKDATGKIEKSPSDVHLTDSSEHILDFVEQSKNAFVEWRKMNRVGGL